MKRIIITFNPTIKPLVSMNFGFINIEKNRITIYYAIILYSELLLINILFFKLDLFILNNNYQYSSPIIDISIINPKKIFLIKNNVLYLSR